MLNPAHYLVVSLIPLNLEYEAQANDGDKSKYLLSYILVKVFEVRFFSICKKKEAQANDGDRTRSKYLIIF